ncbi:MAG: MOSC domain-containing protein [Opitutaceae bacterium]
MNETSHLTAEELAAGWPHLRSAPREVGGLQMIVRRPRIGEREVLAEAELDLERGLMGDNWLKRGSRSMPDGAANPEMQLNVMSARVVNLLARERERWPIAGDQLYVDLDLSVENLPPGTRLAIGSAIIEVTAVPHTGCAKFARRFGPSAVQFVNSPEGKRLRLRGLNAKVVQAGAIREGDNVRRLRAEPSQSGE